MSGYETCSICGEPHEPVTVCLECSGAITNQQIEEAVKAERERCIDRAFGWWCETEMIDYLPTDVALEAIRAALQPK